MSTIPKDVGPEDLPSEFPLLDKILAPQDLHQFTLDQMEALADEIRRQIIETVSVNGGHLASPLGVVELTIALWHVFDMEKDLVVWDVGHQAYAHKILSGRRDRFHTLRTQDGISGYPSRSESPFDPFGTGHSSTSISAALGMAVARDFHGGDGHVIAVIGDGAMTGGMAFEALNHAGHLGRDLLVILNDNEMAISRNVGALSQYFSRMITARPYKRAKEDVSSFVKRLLGRRLTRTAQRLEQSVKGFITAGGLFQEMGFNYVGPVDGHDLPLLIEIFNNMKIMHGPILFHCATQKGKGYSQAEEDPSKYHGVKPAQNEHEGEARPPERPAEIVSARTFTEVFGEAMLDAAENHPSLVGITAAMPAGTGLNRMQEKYPDRFFDVGICEQHAVTFAAGLVTQGMRPVCAIYSTFLQRGYDQFIHDVCLQNLPVVFAVDRAGLVGEDSPTHNGAFDLSFLRAIPNAVVLAPRDGLDLRAMLDWAVKQPGPVVIRYPRDKAPTIGPAEPRDVTRGEILRTGSDATFLGVGPCVGMCLAAADILAAKGLSVGVADARLVKPVDAALVRSLAQMPLLTVEENALPGGFGSAVLEYFEQAGMIGGVRVRRIGLPDAFVEHATRAQQLSRHRLDPAGLAEAARSWLRNT